MQDYEIEAIRKAYATSSWQEICDARDRALKFPKAAEAAELLQEILEERLAEDEKQKQSAAEWSKANTVPERAKTLTPEERKAKELAHLKRITKNGTVVPFVTPESPYRNQRDYDQAHKKSEPAPRSPFSCPNCSPGKPHESCTGHCTSDPVFFERRVMSLQERNAFLAKGA